MCLDIDMSVGTVLPRRALSRTVVADVIGKAAFIPLRFSVRLLLERSQAGPASFWRSVRNARHVD